MDFKVGDVVRFKGYATRMTVEFVFPIKAASSGAVVGQLVKCMWFDKIDQMHRESFKASDLVGAD